MFDEFVQEQARLSEVCRRLRGKPWMALDTEFVRERTFYAQLCLIQIATSDELICIDPLAVSQLDVLLDVIFSPDILKVFHSARQDLEVFHDLRGAPPAPVFDTQIAAALTGYDEQIGYAALVHSVLGIRLEKLHTRADWAARPLSQEQLRYAEEDARYLRDLYMHFKEKLEMLGRADWLTEECARLIDSDRYRSDPMQVYTRIKKGRTLSPAGQNVLRALAAWREITAQTRNRPRNWILRDAVLLELAQKLPMNLQQLEQVEGLGPGTVRKWGDAILETIRQVLETSTPPLWEELKRLDPQQMALCQQMMKLVKARASELKINATIIATRRDIVALLRGDRSSLLLSGWRRQVVGEKLLAMLDGSPTKQYLG